MNPVAVSISGLEQAGPDRWENTEGQNFKCRILVSFYNRRITIKSFTLARNEGAAEMFQVLSEKAVSHGVDKIWLKAEPESAHCFTSTGVRLEAVIPGYYAGKKPALVFAKYLSEQRRTPSNHKNKENISKLVAPDGSTNGQAPLPNGIRLVWGRAEHCRPLAWLYRRVFATYPFPVFDPDYLRYTMDHDVCYITAWDAQALVAAASAEINYQEKNAEMTDFATIPAWRGHGLASCLLNQLEPRLRQEGIRCLYTIARSSSMGMNKVFANTGYRYCGVLVNNCNISGNFEDMNVWSKIITA